MFKKVVIDRFLAAAFWLVLVVVLQVTLLPAELNASADSSVSECAFSGVNPFSSAYAPAALEIETAPELLTSASEEIRFKGSLEPLVNRSLGWLHSWAVGTCFAHLSRPPPSFTLA